MIISDLIERESFFISEKIFLPRGSANMGTSLSLDGPLAGPKTIRLAKKGGGSSFIRAGFRRFSPMVS